jgi:hypothetical protein
VRRLTGRIGIQMMECIQSGLQFFDALKMRFDNFYGRNCFRPDVADNFFDRGERSSVHGLMCEGIRPFERGQALAWNAKEDPRKNG